MITTPHRPDLKEKIFFFISGIIISVPFTVFIQNFADFFCVRLPIFYSTLCSIAILAPLIEEFAKAYPLFYRHNETERSLFTLGFYVGLGFGFFEFILYVIYLGVPIYFRLPGIFFHAASTSIIAYGIATRRPFRFYLLAVVLHFANNFFAIFGLFWYIGGIGSIVITYFLSLHFYKRTTEKVIDNDYLK